MTTELRPVRLYRCLRFDALSGSPVSAAVSSSPPTEHIPLPLLPCPAVSQGPSSSYIRRATAAHRGY